MWFLRAGSSDQVVGYGMLYQYPTSFTLGSTEFGAHGGCAMKSDNFLWGRTWFPLVFHSHGVQYCHARGRKRVCLWVDAK
jgi:hypothetical protein